MRYYSVFNRKDHGASAWLRTVLLVHATSTGRQTVLAHCSQSRLSARPCHAGPSEIPPKSGFGARRGATRVSGEGGAKAARTPTKIWSAARGEFQMGLPKATAPYFGWNFGFRTHARTFCGLGAVVGPPKSGLGGGWKCHFGTRVKGSVFSSGIKSRPINKLRSPKCEL